MQWIETAGGEIGGRGDRSATLTQPAEGSAQANALDEQIADGRGLENYTLFGIGNLTTTSNTVTFGRLSNIDSSTVMKPRDIRLGVRVTF